MNQDTIYEILKYLHLCPEENGGALSAKRLILSQKSYNSLNEKKFEKPVVLSILGAGTEFRSSLNKNSVVYWGDGKITKVAFEDEVFTGHRYTKGDLYVIKIFDNRLRVIMPLNVEEVDSIGEITDLAFMFRNVEIDKNCGKKWDTSGVTDMSNMFRECRSLNKNVGKNWNTSEVTDMSSMFRECRSLNKNVGKNWDTSEVTDMCCMFESCILLDKNVGKYWDTSNVQTFYCMFEFCINLDKNIGKNWNASKTTDMARMFCECRRLNQPIGKKWQTTNVKSIYGMFQYCAMLNHTTGQNWDLSNVVNASFMFSHCNNPNMEIFERFPNI